MVRTSYSFPIYACRYTRTRTHTRAHTHTSPGWEQKAHLPPPLLQTETLAFVSCHSEEDGSCVILWFIGQICIPLPLKLAYNLPHKYLKDRMVETDLSSLIELLAGRGLGLVFISNAPIAPGPLGVCVQNWNSMFKPNPTVKIPLEGKPEECLSEDRLHFMSCLLGQKPSWLP